MGNAVDRFRREKGVEPDGIESHEDGIPCREGRREGGDMACEAKLCNTRCKTGPGDRPGGPTLGIGPGDRPGAGVPGEDAGWIFRMAVRGGGSGGRFSDKGPGGRDGCRRRSVAHRHRVASCSVLSGAAFLIGAISLARDLFQKLYL
ncbi:hypothetical protein AA21291_1525 [Swaminathania salitolerans LMG 21291]|uniref:Uncharacterized protein n=1 Tax=Swaminathania salitolerans TaxID=182838 RepID=A0A511BPY6_9PROT|nr:hypothetical protein AA21291_1525 [Swaminathania salitolerans LMG 21291]GEL02325.1 hypothetical protein SSA02_14880 [Swaminathania salitolerans]